MPYVEAARAAGTNDLQMILRHVLPNIMPPIIVQATHQPRLRDPGRSRPLLPRSRHAAAAILMGPDDPGVARLSRRRALDGARARRRCRADGSRPQHVGRHSPRRLRSPCELAAQIGRIERNRRGARQGKHSERRQPLVSIENLRVEFDTDGGTVVGVDDVTFSIMPRETVCVVGESGSGKSVTSLSLMRLVEFGGGRIARGSLRLARAGRRSRRSRPGRSRISCAAFAAMKSA